MKKQKIAFIRMRNHPIPGMIIPGILEELFPEYEVEILDIVSTSKKRKLIIGSTATFANPTYPSTRRCPAL